MREVKEEPLPQTAIGGMAANKLRAAEEVPKIVSTLDMVKQDAMRPELNGTNDLMEVQALSEHHNCPVCLEGSIEPF